MTDTIQVIIMPVAGQQPINAPHNPIHTEPCIEYVDQVFHHYVYDGSLKMWIHLGGVISLFHSSVLDLLPEPDTLEDAYERAMGVLG